MIGLPAPRNLAPNKAKYTPSMGEPQQPNRKQPAAIRTPTRVMLPAAPAAIVACRVRANRTVAQAANAAPRA